MHRMRCVGAVLISLVVVASAGAAGAQGQRDCRTWLPDFDFGCERQARFEGFSPPMSDPYLFEDPFITTGVSVWGLWHKFPGRSAFRGGFAQAIAVQARLAITDRLAFIATKDGWVNIRPDSAALRNSYTGYMNLAFGFKYAAYVDEDNQFIVTPALRWEMTNGSSDVFSGGGQGLWIPSVSAGKGFGDIHTLYNLGFQLPIDGSKNSSLMFYNFHIDRTFGRLSPFVEVNGLHYIDQGNGSRLTPPLSSAAGGTRVPIGAVDPGFEGLDILNLGNADVDNNDIITGAIGLRYQLDDSAKRFLGVSYARPLTQRKDIIQYRFWVNLTIEM